LSDEIGLDGRHQRYVYNAAGELTHLIEAGGSEQGPGRVTRYERDVLGRLTALRAEGDANCSARYAYDKLGRLVDASNPAAALAFAYDPAGQLFRGGHR
jgi:YD repeat-containing protein